MPIRQDSTHPTGIANDSPRPSTNAIRARERKANAALQLVLAGVDLTTVAESTGYPTARSARVAVEKALEKQLERDPTNKAKMRTLASQRLDRLLLSVWPKATDPEHPEHLLALGKARDIVATWTRLHGLDAPTEVVVHSPTTDMIDQWVARVLSHETPLVTEDDFLDLPEDQYAELTDGGTDA